MQGDIGRRRAVSGAGPSELASLVRAARPDQWTKNLLVFAGIVFAVELGDLSRWRDAIVAFTAYCLGSSAGYLFNDVRDLERDRAHSTKRFRPIAAGELSVRAALTASGVLAAVSIALVAPLGWDSVATLAAFLGLQIGYSSLLKHLVLLDSLAIAALFMIRAAAGAIAVDVRLSPWLLFCTGSLALLLALGKRRAELATTEGATETSRPVLGSYSMELLDQLVSIVAATTITAYSIYTFTATTTEAMMLTIPFVAFGIFRYLFLIHRQGAGEEPDRILVRDVPILAAIALWSLVAVAILVLD